MVGTMKRYAAKITIIATVFIIIIIIVLLSSWVALEAKAQSVDDPREVKCRRLKKGLPTDFLYSFDIN